jgi:hypothetical protein
MPGFLHSYHEQRKRKQKELKLKALQLKTRRWWQHQRNYRTRNYPYHIILRLKHCTNQGGFLISSKDRIMTWSVTGRGTHSWFTGPPDSREEEEKLPPESDAREVPSLFFLGQPIASVSSSSVSCSSWVLTMYSSAGSWRFNARRCLVWWFGGDTELLCLLSSLVLLTSLISCFWILYRRWSSWT